MIRLTILKVTLHLKSGRDLRFLADKLTKRFTGNELTGLEGSETSGWPFYFCSPEAERAFAALSQAEQAAGLCVEPSNQSEQG